MKGLAALVWAASFGLALLRVSFPNDHFDRISRGRQILAYGEHPFADFFDPGYFLTLYVSAAGQALTGGGLLGEALIASAAIATAGALTFRLAASASGSRLVGLAAAALAWFVAPRHYDYDKVLFYTAGLALCWQYLDAPARGPLVAAAVVTALASLFRYDNGLYVFAAVVAGIVVRHRRTPSRATADLVLYAAVVLAALLPALLFIQVTAGVGEALRQVAAYAREEGRRSQLLSLPLLGADRTSVAYVLTVAMVPAALAASLRHLRTRGPTADVDAAKLLAAVVLLGCVCLFVLREPIAARVGAAVPLAAVIAAAIARPPRGTWLAAGCAVVVAGLLALQGTRLQRAPAAIAGRLAALPAAAAASPRSGFFPNDGALAGLTTYLRACTSPDARVLVTWFAPEVFFFSQRGFAGGMAVFLGTHWSSAADQHRTIGLIESQAVPLAIIEAASLDDFRSTYDRVAAHLDAAYREAGATSFGDPRVADDGYRVLIRRSLGDVPRDGKWQLPCPSRVEELHQAAFE